MKKLLCLLLALSTLLCLCACNDDSSRHKKDRNRKDAELSALAGTYKLVSFRDANGLTTAEDLEEDGEDLDEYYMILNSDGTGVICMFGEPYDVGWDKNEIWNADNRSQSYPYSTTGFILTWGTDDEEVTFERTAVEFVSNDETTSIAGTYYAYSEEMNGKVYDRDAMKDAGIDYQEFYITLNNDGTGTTHNPSGSTHISWNLYFLCEDADKDCSDPLFFKIDGDLLIVNSNGSQVTYQKAT